MESGVGIHSFLIPSYNRGENFGLLRWERDMDGATVFISLDVKDKPFTTDSYVILKL